MSAMHHDMAVPRTGRRAAARLRTRLAARMIVHAGEFRIILEDISQTGAKVSAPRYRESGLRPGDNAVLLWHRFERFCTVCWVSPRAIGLAFDEPLGQTDLMTTRRVNEREALPANYDPSIDAARGWVQGQ